MTRTEAYKMAYECAKACGAEMPYADTVARFMVAVAIQESGLRTRRQESFPWHSAQGAFGYWQVELETAEDCMEYLNRAWAAPYATPIAQWLFEDQRAYGGWSRIVNREILRWMLLCSDRLGCLLARLKILQAPGKVPHTCDEAFTYWLKYYNGGGVLRHMDHDTAAKGFNRCWRDMESALGPGAEQ